MSISVISSARLPGEDFGVRKMTAVSAIGESPPWIEDEGQPRRYVTWEERVGVSTIGDTHRWIAHILERMEPTG